MVNASVFQRTKKRKKEKQIHVQKYLYFAHVFNKKDITPTGSSINYVLLNFITTQYDGSFTHPGVRSLLSPIALSPTDGILL